MENSKSSKPTEADYVRQGAIDAFRTVIDTTPKIKRSWDPLKIKKEELPDYIKYDPVLWQFFRRLHYQNKNFICLIVGEPGAGKSLSAIKLAQMLDITPLGNGKFRENFVLKQGKDGKADAGSKLVFGPSDFLRLVKSGLQRGSCIVWDEAGVGNDATKWNDRKSQLIKHIMQTFRSRNYGVFMTVPDKESVTLSTRRLVHCYIDVFKRTPTHAEMNIVWLKRERTGEKTTTYYKRPTFVDPISGQLKKIFVYRIPKISWSIENTYNKIKDSTLQNLYEFYQREMEIMEKELGMDQEQGLSAGKKLKKFNMSSAVEICNEVAEDLLGEDFRPSEAKIILRMSTKGYDCSKQQAKLVAELVNQKGNTGMN